MGRPTSALAAVALAGPCHDCPENRYAPRAYDETLDEWAGDGMRPNCNQVEAGTRADGKQFLAQVAIFAADVRYFDDQHQFLGGAQSGDVIIDGCTPGSYGPTRDGVRCQVLEHAPLCGDETTANFGLPFAD